MKGNADLAAVCLLLAAIGLVNVLAEPLRCVGQVAESWSRAESARIVQQVRLHCSRELRHQIQLWRASQRAERGVTYQTVDYR